jgi:hypothetical protein
MREFGKSAKRSDINDKEGIIKKYERHTRASMDKKNCTDTGK